MSTRPPFRVVIPARYASTRLPGKPLREIAGKPMLRWVWENACAAGARQVVVATDDARIAQVVEGFGGEVVMTSAEHTSGTDRLAEVAARAGWPQDDCVVNLQGDEPCTPAHLVQQVAGALDAHPPAGIATLATPIGKVEEAFDPNVVKVVVDGRGFACYFSRAPIPWLRGQFGDPSRPPPELPQYVPFLRHLGLYAYRVGTLSKLAATEPCPVERAESLEQLRALHLGIAIHVGVIAEPPGHGVDTEQDLQRVTAILEQGMSATR